MMMPVFPGAPWVPKYKGIEGELKYVDWKEQVYGLLNAQELTETKKVDILIGALAGEAKQQVNVLDEAERNEVRKIFNYLDTLYGDTIPVAVLRSQFFGCMQKPDESVKSFTLRLRKLGCRLRQRSPTDAPTDANLLDQMLLGLREGPLSNTLRAYVRHNPGEDFAAVHREALQLEEEHNGSQRLQSMCLAVGGTSAFSPQKWKSHQVWEEAFAVCQRISATKTGGDSPEYVRPACRRGIQVPPNCETMIWGRTSQKMRSKDGLVLVEAISGSEQWGVARTLSVVDRGRLPVRVCNPHPYPIKIGPYEKLGRLYQVEETEIQGAGDLSLTMGSDGVVEVGVTEAVEMGEPNPEVNKLLTSVDLPPQQKVELQAFLQRWKKVFSVDEEDVGRTDLVQHSIHTGSRRP
ncbi:uncharacterized protein LOC107833047 isoform X2 [Poecilia formosa]|uniref:uncharacterized protein LOC107833047 isoform X2 n=1 Tax=Poecilia formosa TaxID=48698 RepID=UPI0007B8718B|nr:PREDICTED: uncharacterized protein LOC107833047 isoform X2 [Poecilia formosa]